MEDQPKIAIDLLGQVEAVCQNFEDACAADLVSADIADYLEQVEPAARDHLLVELILLEADYANKAGISLDRDDYLAKFAPRTSAVNIAFSKIETQQNNAQAKFPDIGDRFKLLALIGTGGMGNVYRGRDDRLGRDVAIKIVKKDCVELDQRFEREIRLTASLTHPNIVSLYDFLEHQGTKFAVMEFVEGRTLRQQLQANAQLAEPHAIQIAIGIAQALTAAHQLEIIHRDIKPENVIATESGQVKVLDFGLARPTVVGNSSQLTATAKTPGTFPYMSPEQVAGKPLTCASDIFSLGTVLLEMLTGVNAFLGESIVETIGNLFEFSQLDWSKYQSDVRPPIQALINGLLQREPENRPDANSVVDRLTELQSAEES